MTLYAYCPMDDVFTDSDATALTGWQRLRALFQRLGPAGPLAVVCSTLPPIGGFVLLGSVAAIAPWMREHQATVLPIYAVAFAVLCGLAVLPTYSVSIVTGWVFGFAVGLPVAMAGFMGGTLLMTVVAKQLAGRRVVELIAERPKWAAVRDAAAGGSFGRTLGVVTLLRLPPSSPFAIGNFVLATADVPLAPLLLGTLIGMTPRTAVVVWTASRLQELNWSNPGAEGWVVLAGVALTVGVVIALGVMANRVMARITEQDTTEPAQT